MQSFIPKNKFVKLVHLVGFVVRIYHDARSPELHICIIMPCPCSQEAKCNCVCVSVCVSLPQHRTLNPLTRVQRRKKAAKSNGRGSLGEVRCTLFPKGGVRTILLEGFKPSPSRPYDSSNVKMGTFAS
jgi:hypothetical protein